MRITDFVVGRGVEKQAVYRYLTRHPELMEKCTKEGKEIDLPDAVVAALEEQYPLQKPVIVVDGLPPEEERQLRQQLQQAQEQLIRMQQELGECRLQLAAKEQTEMLLGMKSEELEKATLELDRLKNRGLWERLINKI